MSIVYYRIPFLRCAELDIVFGAMIAMCIYIVMKPLLSPKSSVSKVEKVVEPAIPVKDEKEERHVYSVDFIRSVNPGTIPDAHFTYQVTSRSVPYRQSYSPMPYSSRKSPDPYNYYPSHSPNPDGFISRSPRGRLDPEDEALLKKMRDLTPDFCSDVTELPTDVRQGTVNYFVKAKSNGRITCHEPIQGKKDIFFHLKDCVLEDGEKIELGDTVMFEVSTHDNLMCAVNVRKTEKAPSPDFSRRVMKHSKEDAPAIPELNLYQCVLKQPCNEGVASFPTDTCFLRFKTGV